MEPSATLAGLTGSRLLSSVRMSTHQTDKYPSKPEVHEHQLIRTHRILRAATNGPFRFNENISVLHLFEFECLKHFF